MLQKVNSKNEKEKAAYSDGYAEREGICQLRHFTANGIARHILDSGLNVDKSVVSFIENCLFTTLTNVNFNVDDHVHLLKQSQKPL